MHVVFLLILWFCFAIALGLVLGKWIHYHDRGASPAWGRFASAEEFQAFLDCVANYFQSRHRQAIFTNGLLLCLTQHADASAKSHETSAMQISLVPLAVQCCGADPREWPALIARYVEAIDAAGSESALKEVMIDFDRVRQLLAVQLGLPPKTPTAALVCSEDLPGICSYLVLDLPDAVRTISPGEAARWGLAMEEVFQIARKNMSRVHLPDAEPIELAEGITAFAITGDSPLTAAAVLKLEQRPELLGSAGALVALPTQHILIVLPLRDAPATEAMVPLLWTARRRYEEGPGSITPNLFWYQNGVFSAIENG